MINTLYILSFHQILREIIKYIEATWVHFKRKGLWFWVGWLLWVWLHPRDCYWIPGFSKKPSFSKLLGFYLILACFQKCTSTIAPPLLACKFLVTQLLGYSTQHVISNHALYNNSIIQISRPFKWLLKRTVRSKAGKSSICTWADLLPSILCNAQPSGTLYQCQNQWFFFTRFVIF
jgi:hypothetical protein